MVVCRKRGFLFSSFDKKAISAAKESGVSVITAGAIFKGLLLKGIATKKEYMTDMRNNNNTMTDMLRHVLTGAMYEETCIPDVPCVTLRDNTGRSETVEVGSNMLAGIESERII